MVVHTKLFGDIEVQDQDIIRFEDGLPGFDALKRFALIEVEEYAPFAYLQSIDDGDVAFIVTDPFEFFSNYECELPDQVVAGLSIESAEQLTVRVIVSIHEELETATANLVAPVIINQASRSGKQVVLTKTNYTTRHALFQANESK